MSLIKLSKIPLKIDIGERVADVNWERSLKALKAYVTSRMFAYRIIIIILNQRYMLFVRRCLICDLIDVYVIILQRITVILLIFQIKH